MAKVKIKIGNNEIEVDSRDFYIDNQSMGQVIADISKHLTDSSALIYENTSTNTEKTAQTDLSNLTSLVEAEVHEPEFSNPIQITGDSIKPKLEILENNAFFDKPRTVSEVVGQLYEYGWIVSPLETSKILTKMVFHRELTKNSENNKNYYSIKENLITS